jgi:HEAT repeat protein
MLWYNKLRFRSKNPAVRRRALQPLTYAPHAKAFNFLAAALKDPDAEVRALAAEALGQLESERKAEPLVTALQDRDPEVLKAALHAMRKITKPSTLNAIEPLLRSTDGGVRAVAAQTLQNNNWKPKDRESEIWLWVAAGQFRRTTVFGVAAIPALEAALSMSNYSTSLGIVDALGGIGGPQAMRPLLAAMRSQDASVCLAAVDAIRRIGDRQAIPQLVGLLRDGYGHIRVAAIEALGEFGAETALDQIRPQLKDSMWDVRRAAAQALGRLKDMTSMPGLINGLKDSDADVREACAMALGRIGSKDAIGPLVLAQKDETSGVRRIAAAALSRIDEDWTSTAEARAAAEQLKLSFGELEPDVRFFVHRLLQGIAPPEKTLVMLEKKSAAPDSEAMAAVNKRRLTVSLFFGLLTDINRDLRQAAAEALGRIGDTRAISSLTRALGDSDGEVRTAAEQSLRALGWQPGAANAAS